MRSVIKKAFNKMGYSIHKSQPGVLPPNSLNVYNAALLGLAAGIDRKIHFCVVGANDGRHGDPAYDLIVGPLKAISTFTLIEPQMSLVEKVEDNYSAHRDFSVINGAIGPDEEMSLYCIAENIWPYTQPSYAKTWPIYRAPTGITSTDRASVIAWGKEYINEVEWKDDFVEEIRVKSMDLLSTLRAYSRPPKVDVLQIDAEGFDDVVIQCSNLDLTQPNIVHFEAKHINESRLEMIMGQLDALDYHSVRIGPDILSFSRAVASGSGPHG